VVTDLSTLATTRRAWHAVAELVLAGPQDRQSHSIKLRVTPGGFATTKEPTLTVERAVLVTASARVALHGRSCASLADEVGAPTGKPADRYHEGSGVEPDEVLELDDAALAVLADGFDTGDAALRRFTPTQVPVLWPEHFDVGITVGEVNYGISPGDTYLGEPYAYVGPWQPRSGAFWNAPFGAAVPMRTLAFEDAVVDFFTEGRDRAAS
jgi:hypothetical protein